MQPERNASLFTNLHNVYAQGNTNWANTIALWYQGLSPEGQAVISDISPMFSWTGGSPGDIESETTVERVDNREGESQGWVPAPPLLFEPTDSLRCEEDIGSGLGELPWELPSGEKQESSHEVCPKGWTIHYEHDGEGSFSRGSVSRGPLTSPCWKRRHSDIDSSREQEGRQGPSATRGDDREEFKVHTAKRCRSETPAELLQLECAVGSGSDSDSMGTNEHGQNSSSEGTYSECTTDSPLGSLEDPEDWNPWWNNPGRYEFQSPPEGSPDPPTGHGRGYGYPCEIFGCNNPEGHFTHYHHELNPWSNTQP